MSVTELHTHTEPQAKLHSNITNNQHMLKQIIKPQARTPITVKNDSFGASARWNDLEVRRLLEAVNISRPVSETAGLSRRMLLDISFM
jgi:hypothetical protein